MYLPELLTPINDNKNSISCPSTRLTTQPNANLSFLGPLCPSRDRQHCGTWTPRGLPRIGSFKRPWPVGLGRRTSSVVLGPDSCQMSVCCISKGRIWLTGCHQCLGQGCAEQKDLSLFGRHRTVPAAPATCSGETANLHAPCRPGVVGPWVLAVRCRVGTEVGSVGWPHHRQRNPARFLESRSGSIVRTGRPTSWSAWFAVPPCYRASCALGSRSQILQPRCEVAMSPWADLRERQSARPLFPLVVSSGIELPSYHASWKALHIQCPGTDR